MLINVNTESLIKEKLTASQYIALYLLFEQKYATFIQLVEEYKLHQEMEDLVSKGYFLAYDKKTRPESIPSNKAKIRHLLDLGDSGFWELLGNYPLKVPADRGGARYLRPSSHTSESAAKLKKKYDSILKRSKHTHEHIMRCLDAELWFRRRGDSMKFMHNLETWLDKRHWEQYENLLEMSNERKTEAKYGEDLI